MYSYKAKSVFSDHLGSSNDSCYIQNYVITNRVIKRLRLGKLEKTNRCIAGIATQIKKMHGDRLCSLSKQTYGHFNLSCTELPLS